MTALLARLLGRLPIGWLQLTHSRTRLLAALAGVSFANVLVLVQLGILNALNATIVEAYSFLDADIMISSADANTMTDGGNVARQWLFLALTDAAVIDGAALFVDTVVWNRHDGDASLQTFGIDPARMTYLREDLRSATELLHVHDAAALDRATRGLAGDTADAIDAGNPLLIELAGRTITMLATFEGGVSFSADGYMLVSDQTFMRVFPNRVSGAPDHILLRTVPGSDIDATVARLSELLPAELVQVRSVAAAAAADQNYQSTQRPTGIIFGFGVVIGILVGLVIVYQVLSTDVADHLREYATFKAIGYPASFFRGIILEEAVILGALGFVPGIAISLALYLALSSATGLPLSLAFATAFAVLIGTIAACAASGLLAARRLAQADPADLF